MAAVLKHLQQKRRREQINESSEVERKRSRQDSSSDSHSSSGSCSTSDDSQDSVLTELKPSTPEICDKLLLKAPDTTRPFAPVHNLENLQEPPQARAPPAQYGGHHASACEQYSAESVESETEYIHQQNMKVDATIAAVLAMAKDPKSTLTFDDSPITPTALPSPPSDMSKLSPSVRHRAPNGQRTQHQCAFCPKLFPSKAQYEKHVRTHTGEKPYSCHFCDATFGRKDRLRMHIRIHTGEKPHRCENCDSKFTTREQLVKHVKVHTGQRDYICGECDKRFAEKSDLKRHVLIHTDQRPFDCKTCGRTFKRKYSLQVHNRLHTGEKPYTCLTCDKAFHTSSHLSSHIQSNHL